MTQEKGQALMKIVRTFPPCARIVGKPEIIGLGHPT
jgi:hypothetical protein